MTRFCPSLLQRNSVRTMETIARAERPVFRAAGTPIGIGYMYAVIRTGGKQYRVAKDDKITVERLPGDEGSEITIDQVLMLGGDSPRIGSPTVEGASVKATIVAQSRADKVIIFKKRRRKSRGPRMVTGSCSRCCRLRLSKADPLDRAY